MKELLLLTAWLALACAPTLNKPELRDEVVDETRDALNREALTRRVEDASRLIDIGHRIRKLGVDLCGDQTTRLIGLRIMRKTRGHSDFDDVLRQTYGIGDGPAVVYVVPGSAAERAGVQLRDIVLEVAGRGINDDEDLRRRLRRAGGGPLAMLVHRDGKELSLALDAPVACDHHALVSRSSWMTTYPAQNRRDFFVTLGAIEFAASDDELAVVIAHQIAHFVVAPLTTESAEAEIAADRLGLHLAARAGYDVTVAVAMLERITLEKPEMLNRRLEPRWRRSYNSLHLFAPERLVAMPVTLAEIAAKQAAGEPLSP